MLYLRFAQPTGTLPKAKSDSGRSEPKAGDLSELASARTLKRLKLGLLRLRDALVRADPQHC